MLLKSTCISNHYMAWLHWHTKHLPFCAAFLPLSTFAFRVKQYQNSCTDSLFPFADFCPTCRVSFVSWESLKWSTIKYIFISMFISRFSSSFFALEMAYIDLQYVMKPEPNYYQQQRVDINQLSQPAAFYEFCEVNPSLSTQRQSGGGDKVHWFIKNLHGGVHWRHGHPTHEWVTYVVFHLRVNISVSAVNNNNEDSCLFCGGSRVSESQFIWRKATRNESKIEFAAIMISAD